MLVYVDLQDSGTLYHSIPWSYTPRNDALDQPYSLEDVVFFSCSLPGL